MVSKKLQLFSSLLAAMLLVIMPLSFADTVNDQSNDLAAETVRVAVDDIPIFFSPYARAQLKPQYAHLFFDPLVRWGIDQKIEKQLVDHWENITPSIVRFYLKKNIKFHSGNELSGSDVSWTFLQILKEPQARRTFAGISAIKQVDSYSFDVYSHLPLVRLLDYFTHFFVLDATFYQKNNIAMNRVQEMITNQDKTVPISGTGPFIIKTYNAQSHLNVVRSNNYWQGEVSIKALNFIKIKSPSSRAFALLADDIDISESVESQMFDTVSYAESKSLIEVSPANVVFLTINNTKLAVLRSQPIRHMINLAINKEGMLKHIIGGMGKISAQYSPLQEVESEQPEYDVTKAKQLLSKIKMPEELTLLVLSDDIGYTSQFGNAFSNMMKRMGIKVLITQVDDLDEWNKRLAEFDFSLSVWHSPLMNSDNVYHDLFVNSVLSHYFSRKFEQEKIENSLIKQVAFFERMQQTYQIIPLLFQNKIWATDNTYNLADIFSVNGIPYWYLLTGRQIQ